MAKKLKLLAIGHVWPQPNATAAGEHMVHLLSFFKKMNYDILFVSAAQKPHKYHELERLNIQNKQIKINDNDFDLLLKGYEPTVVLFDRFMTEEQFSWRIYKNCPKALRILDTEDLHFLRNERQVALKKTTEGTSDIFKREIASIYRCDLSLIISQKEIQLLTQTYNVPSELLIYVPLLCNSLPDTTPTFEERKDLIFMGNFLHLPNWNCVQYLKKEIWPKLSSLLPETTLHIYGSHASDKHFQLSNPKQRFLIHGYIENLTAVLVTSKLLIAPLQFGAGQKGKLLKAMQYGLPSVTTSIGAEGMIFDNVWSGLIANTPEEIINQTLLLYNNKKEWTQAQQKCHTIIATNFDFEYHFINFEKRLQDLKSTIDNHRATNFMGQVLWHHSLRSTEFMSRWIIEKNK